MPSNNSENVAKAQLEEESLQKSRDTWYIGCRKCSLVKKYYEFWREMQLFHDEKVKEMQDKIDGLERVLNNYASDI